MPRHTVDKTGRVMRIAIVCIIILALAAVGFVYQNRLGGPRESSEEAADTAKTLPKPPPVIDYGKLEKEEALGNIMQERKSKYGIEHALDMVVKSDETIKVGGKTVSMEEIIDKVRLKTGGLVEKDLDWRRDNSNNSENNQEEFGVYVVQPGDNIWNIHFELLKEYFSKRGVTLPSLSDEPTHNGTSTGVGKILKFSESMVYIFNLESRRLDSEINTIYPLRKVVIYRMDEVFLFLEQIDFKKIEKIRFDGETLWVSEEN